MSFFTKKQEVKLEDFCREYFDEIITRPVTHEPFEGTEYIMSLHKELEAMDSRFKNVDALDLIQVLTALRFVLFALAWSHRFGEDLAIKQCLFMNQYFKDNGMDYLRPLIIFLNKGVSKATVAGVSDLAKANFYKKRADSADKYIALAEKEGLDFNDENILQAIGIAVNQFLSEKSWKKGKSTLLIVIFVSQFLLSHMCSEEAQSRLKLFVNGTYKAVKSDIKNIEIID